MSSVKNSGLVSRMSATGIPLRSSWSLLLLCFMLLASLLTSACGGDAHTQQQAAQNKAHLDSALQQAQSIGVTTSLLSPVQQQEQQLSGTHAPFNLFNEQPATDYYSNLATRYARLTTQVQGIIAVSTEQSQTQAQQAMQGFQTTLAQRRSQGLPVQHFTQQFSQNQSLLASAKYPKDYIPISRNARAATQALDLMQADFTKLRTLQQTIVQMQNAHIDVTAITTQYQNDQQSFAAGTTPADFQNLNELINAQYQQAIVNSIQALPFVTAAKLGEFKTQVDQLQLYGGKASAYQKRLDADTALMSKTRNIEDYLTFSKQVDADMAAMHGDLVQNEARYLIKQFHQEVDAWGNAHLYHDTYDGQNYALNTGYMAAGMGSDIDNDLSAATTTDDYQNMVSEANNALFNLHMLEADYNDKTPYNQVHATDMQMIDHYKLQKGQILMVSLVEQAMRVYQDGKLVKFFLVTTGRAELPSVPGVWPVMDRRSPTIFRSSEPKTSPYWYPDTPIHYAILYHWGGYFVHDSWWRNDYGPGTQFPHIDSSGNAQFSNSGSHGCINMQEDQAAWVYNNTDWNTMIVIY